MSVDFKFATANDSQKFEELIQTAITDTVHSACGVRPSWYVLSDFLLSIGYPRAPEFRLWITRDRHRLVDQWRSPATADRAIQQLSEDEASTASLAWAVGMRPPVIPRGRGLYAPDYRLTAAVELSCLLSCPCKRTDGLPIDADVMRGCTETWLRDAHLYYSGYHAGDLSAKWLSTIITRMNEPVWPYAAPAHLMTRPSDGWSELHTEFEIWRHGLIVASKWIELTLPYVLKHHS